jgi:hypothetical protein
MDRATLIRLSKDPRSKYYVEPEHFEQVYLPHVTKGYKLRDGILFSNAVQNLSIVKNIKIRLDDIFLGIRKVQK